VKKRILFLTMLLLTALLFGGCAMRTASEMYALPRRSQEYSQLQSAIDSAMVGMTYSAPLSGENRQTVQMADLNGDGVDEYLIFASDNSDKPLKVLIFVQTNSGECRLIETIESNGSAFEQVEYVDFDNHPGKELVIGRQVSDRVLRSVSVYTFRDRTAEQQLLVGYSRFLTCDLDDDGHSEILVLRPSEAEAQRGTAVLYSSHNGQISRSVEMELSREPASIRRITQGDLQCKTPAVFVASAVDDMAIVTDIFAMKEGKFTNIAFSGEADTSIRTLRNYYVYAEDIDNDGILELPGLISMKPVTNWKEQDQDFLLRWFSMDVDGREMDKRYTFHNFTGGWYLDLHSALATRITVDQRDDVYYFHVWDSNYERTELLFTVYVLTGAERDEEAVTGGRFALHRTETVAYAAKLESGASAYDITEEDLMQRFYMIRQDR